MSWFKGLGRFDDNLGTFDETPSANPIASGVERSVERMKATTARWGALVKQRHGDATKSPEYLRARLEEKQILERANRNMVKTIESNVYDPDIFAGGSNSPEINQEHIKDITRTGINESVNIVGAKWRTMFSYANQMIHPPKLNEEEREHNSFNAQKNEAVLAVQGKEVVEEG